MIPCPKCGEKERYAATWTTKETYWTCQRCGYQTPRLAATSSTSTEDGEG